MQDDRYYLIDGELLARLMRCPDAGGVRHTVRSLAAVSGIGKSKLASMLHNRQTGVSGAQAHAIAEAVGVRRKALFAPSKFAFANTTKEETGDPGGTQGARHPGRAHQLGQHR